MTRIEEIIEYEAESHLLDFKVIPYELGDNQKKGEFLKDLSSMANNPANEDKYIIIGIKEKNGIASDFYNISKINDQAQFQQYLDSNIEPSIKFEYIYFTYKEYSLAYFRIFNNVDRPYLLKKDVVISEQGQKINFHKGDGFIRVGTSTRRLERSDFDNIYQGKLNASDRRSDLEVSVNIDKAENDFNIQDEKYFDLRIENKSNKSIGFDIEMTVYFDQIVSVRSADSLKRTMILPKSGNPFDIVTIHNPILPNLDVYIEENDKSLFIERNKRKFEQYAVQMSQKSIINAVFFQELIIKPRSNFTIKAEVVIRSDEFIDGPITLKIEQLVENLN